MEIAILLYDGFTALDAVGPYEVLAQLPDTNVRFVAEERGVRPTDTLHLRIEATHDISEVSSADLLLIPGGSGDELVVENEKVLEWVRRIHETTRFTTSVCSGSLILGAAGVLQGKRATSHWMRLERLREYGAEPTAERVVEDGKVFTAAGVSAGIDLGLRLVQRIAGDDLAQVIQLAIEYDPDPPFDVGSPRTAPLALVEAVRGGFEATVGARLEHFRKARREAS